MGRERCVGTDFAHNSPPRMQETAKKSETNSEKKSGKKWALFVLRWTIAVVGIWYVISNISWRDRAIILNAQNRPVQVRLAHPAEENSPSVWYLDPADDSTHQVFRS